MIAPIPSPSQTAAPPLVCSGSHRLFATPMQNPEWDKLPRELLDVIAQHQIQKNPNSAAALRLVSRQWRESATDQVRALRPPQISCLRSLANSFPKVKFLWLTEQATEASWQRIVQEIEHTSSTGPAKQLNAVPISSFMFQSLVTPIAPELDLSHLSQFGQLTHLRLERNNYVTDLSLRSVGRLKSLVHLSIARCIQVTDTGLLALANCAQLESLNLDCCSWLTDEGFSALQKLTRLTNLSARDSAISDRGLAVLNKLLNLRSLNLSYCSHLTGNVPKALLGLTRLSHLKLDGVYMRLNEEFASAGGFDRFRSLSFKDSRLSDLALIPLRNCRQLTDLNVSGNFKISDGGLLSLGPLTSLKILKLEKCFLKSASSLIQLTNLRYLNLKDCSLFRFDEEKLFSRLKKLQHLNVQGCHIHSNHFSLFSRLSSLTHLNAARGSQNEKSALVQFGPFPDLHYLNLGNWTIAKGALTSLSGCSRLVHLNLAACNLKKGEIDQIQGLTQLTHLNIARSRARPERLLKILSCLTNLSHLNLSDCNFTDGGAKQLSTFAQLSSLDLSKNRGVSGLALENLERLIKLRSLHLRNTGVTSQGCNHLAKFSKLTYLDLSQCDVGDGIFPTLKKLLHLRHLDVRNTSVTPYSIASLLATSPSLKQLHENSHLTGLSYFERNFSL